MTTRRSLLQSALALSATSLVPPTVFSLAAESGNSDTDATASTRIPEDFVGFGYEMSSVGRVNLLSGENRMYVQLLRNLGQKGVLRLGGIVADFTSYSADGPAAALPKHTVITRESLRKLRSLLDATGWTAIWSVNFGSGSLDEAVVEARAVSEVLGPRLLAIELGNEVENYSLGERPLRTPPYAYENYRAEYSRWRSVLHGAVPDLRFAAPDTAASVEWVERMAADAQGEVQLLTTHYYRGDQRKGSQDQLLQADEELLDRLRRLRDASKKSGIPWRMCETNSFFGGGRPGVSDTFAGALWTLDFMLLLATHGCAGVNMETGVNQLGFVSSYSPIQDDGAGHNSAGAPYYGMLAFATAVSGAREVLKAPESPDRQLSVYTLGSGGRVRSVTLVNRSETSSISYPVERFGLRKPGAFRLTGPSLAGTTGIRFGDAGVDAEGRWGGVAAPLSFKAFTVPAASAMVIRGM